MWSAVQSCGQVSHGVLMDVQVCSSMCYSRSLRPGSVLSELTVMNGEIWTKITAELQRTDGAERRHSVGIATTQHSCLTERSFKVNLSRQFV